MMRWLSVMVMMCGWPRLVIAAGTTTTHNHSWSCSGDHRWFEKKPNGRWLPVDLELKKVPASKTFLPIVSQITWRAIEETAANFTPTRNKNFGAGGQSLPVLSCETKFKNRVCPGRKVAKTFKTITRLRALCVGVDGACVALVVAHTVPQSCHCVSSSAEDKVRVKDVLPIITNMTLMEECPRISGVTGGLSNRTKQKSSDNSDVNSEKMSDIRLPIQAPNVTEKLVDTSNVAKISGQVATDATKSRSNRVSPSNSTYHPASTLDIAIVIAVSIFIVIVLVALCKKLNVNIDKDSPEENIELGSENTLLDETGVAIVETHDSKVT